MDDAVEVQLHIPSFVGQRCAGINALQEPKWLHAYLHTVAEFCSSGQVMVSVDQG